MKKYVYKYYRLSLDDEKDVESNSISNQRQIVESHLSTISELANMPSVEVVDDGYTGTNFNRPGMKQLLDAVRRGEVGCIIVKDLSRFGRKYLEVSKYIEQLFPYLGIRFIAVGDIYDSDTHKGTTANLDVPVRNMLNALYSKKVSKDVKSVKQTQARQGKYIHAFAPFGYMKDPADKHRIIIDEPAAEIVRRVFELICDGKTPKQIADTFNSENVPTPSAYKKEKGSKLKTSGITGATWTYHTINNLLRNEQYTGTFIAGKVEMGELGSGKLNYKSKEDWIMIEDNHPAIITKDAWNEVIAKRGKVNSAQSKRSKPDTDRMLYKRVRCGYCGHVMRYRQGAKRDIYACQTYKYTVEHGCSDEQYDEQDIVGVVKAVVQSHIAIMLDMERLSDTLKKASRQRATTSQNTSEGLGVEIEQLQASKRQLYERYKKGSIDKEAYFKEREAVENKISEKTVERESLDNRNSGQEEVLNTAHYFFDSFTQFNATDEPSADVVNVLVEAVNIFGKDRIEVKFSFADKLEKALQALNQGM